MRRGGLGWIRLWKGGREWGWRWDDECGILGARLEEYAVIILEDI